MFWRLPFESCGAFDRFDLCNYWVSPAKNMVANRQLAIANPDNTMERGRHRSTWNPRRIPIARESSSVSWNVKKNPSPMSIETCWGKWYVHFTTFLQVTTFWQDLWQVFDNRVCFLGMVNKTIVVPSCGKIEASFFVISRFPILEMKIFWSSS